MFSLFLKQTLLLTEDTNTMIISILFIQRKAKEKRKTDNKRDEAEN